MNNSLENNSAEHNFDEEDSSDAAFIQQNEEVELAKAVDDNTSEDVQNTDDSMENLMDMYEESFKRFAEGEVVTGRIISVDKDYILVDIGYKSEGQIRINEFKDENGDGDGSKWNTQLVESTIFQYLLSIFVFAGVFAMILGIARRMRK